MEIIRLVFWLLIAIIAGITILCSVYFITNKEERTKKEIKNKEVK